MTDAEVNKTEIELQKLRFDFAWKHFDFHAKQRTTMFQYFVTILPFIVAGYFYFLKEKPFAFVPAALLLISVVGAASSVVFALLDKRNQDLYSISERNLKILEEIYLYQAPVNGFRGIITEEQATYGNKPGYWIFKFRFLMKCIYFGATLMFGGMGYYAICLMRHWHGLSLN